MNRVSSHQWRLRVAIFGACIVLLPYFAIDTSRARASELSIIQNVIKLKTYEEQGDGSFVFKSFGSAIAVSGDRVLTNAHVILGSDGEPTGLYEACFSSSYESAPRCRDRARLLAYDVTADLALLQLENTRSLRPFSLGTGTISIGQGVSLYGYPVIGGKTITRTEGRIAGYEQAMYKIDGTVDHGNSGGGAFNEDGELVGMPTAISADNAVIAYMIGVKRIQSFLAGKTSGYTLFTIPATDAFRQFISQNHRYNTSRLIQRFGDISLRNPRTQGFRLVDTMVSRDANMIIWTYMDEQDRVQLSFSCTSDAGTRLGWQVRHDGIDWERQQYPDWQIRTEDSDRFFTVYESSKDYPPSITLYYKDYDRCFAEIRYIDEKKDKVSLESALKALRSGLVIQSPYILPTTHTNPYFQIDRVPDNVRVIRSIDTSGTESVVLGVELQKGKWLHNGIKSSEYKTLSDLAGALFVETGSLDSSDSYASFLRKRDPSTIVSILGLPGGKRGIFLEQYDAEKKQKRIAFRYIYRTDAGKYAYWSWFANFPTSTDIDVTHIRRIFELLQYPGKSLFQ